MHREILPIFSGGTGRSGTTIVGKLLSRHPEIRGGQPYEIRFINDRFGLLDLCYGVEGFEDLWKRMLSTLYLNHISPRKRTFFFQRFESRLRGKWWKRTNRIGEVSGLHRSLAEADLEEILDIFRLQFPRDHVQASRNFVFDFLQRQRHNQNERIWVDTTPLNISVADRIYLLFPEAKFIHMRRDGRDTVASVIKEDWGPNNPIAALRWWERRMIASLTALRAVPQEQVLELNLEDFVVRNRDESYKKLFDFVGVKDSLETRKYFEKEMPANRLRIAKYREEIQDWRELDRAYQESTTRLNSLFPR